MDLAQLLYTIKKIEIQVFSFFPPLNRTAVLLFIIFDLLFIKFDIQFIIDEAVGMYWGQKADPSSLFHNDTFPGLRRVKFLRKRPHRFGRNYLAGATCVFVKVGATEKPGKRPRNIERIFVKTVSRLSARNVTF
jgi:hypothetical protein